MRFVCRHGQELSHELNFVVNVGWYVVCKVKFIAGQLAQFTQTFKLFVVVHDGL